MSRKWWFILTVTLVTATLCRNRLRTILEQAYVKVRVFDLPSAGAYDVLVERAARRAAGAGLIRRK